MIDIAASARWHNFSANHFPLSAQTINIETMKKYRNDEVVAA
jgi:hypothetical protein